jgi:hypothetical protein
MTKEREKSLDLQISWLWLCDDAHIISGASYEMIEKRKKKPTPGLSLSAELELEIRLRTWGTSFSSVPCRPTPEYRMLHQVHIYVNMHIYTLEKVIIPVTKPPHHMSRSAYYPSSPATSQLHSVWTPGHARSHAAVVFSTINWNTRELYLIDSVLELWPFFFVLAPRSSAFVFYCARSRMCLLQSARTIIDYRCEDRK